DIIGIYLNVVTARSGIELSKKIKENSQITVVLGGPFVPEQLDRLLDQSKADIFVQGEAEVTFLEICQGKEREKIDGIMYMEKNKLMTNKPRELIANIDELPYAAYHLLPNLSLYSSRSRKKPIAPIFTSRGCPYKCTFCSSSSAKSPFKNRFRVRSPENVVGEIEYLIKNFGVKEIDILDDNFTLDMKRADDILNLIIARKLKVAINLQNGVRADRLTFDLVKKMKQAGVYKAGIGIESGNQDILRSIKKQLNLDAVRNAVKWFKEVGIVSIGFFVIGLPEDTEETIKQTINFAIELNPSIANFMTAVPLPNTELYDLVEKKGWLIKKTDENGTESGFYAADFHYETPNLTKEKVLELQKVAYRKFYFRPSKMLEVIRDIRSLHELKWTIAAAKPLIHNMFRHKKNAEVIIKEVETVVPS
ncbi:radical SAM protein, partial [Candidatus Woesearchaeota archaeon]|nr:radical SAM protein [Candidatus Woesearchaeota archaeon]